MIIIRGCLLAAAVVAIATPSRAIEVKEVGSFHVGGRSLTIEGMPIREMQYTAGGPITRTDPNGDVEVEQMYVQYVKLAQPKAKYPLLLWHGGGLTGVTWETKPDGQPGWQSFFLEAGHDVYVSDAVERGRASWARYPEVFKSDPVFRTKKEAWEAFRLGPEGAYATDPAKRVARKGLRFPVEAFDQFMKQSVPRWTTNDAVTLAAYKALVDKVCPCVIITHSQGGNFGFNAALHAPDKVKALVSIEPSGAPDPAKVDVKSLRNTPHLVVWGDWVEEDPLWKKLSVASGKYLEGLAAAGVPNDSYWLPKLGITGNDHMLMMDNNSDEVAQLIQKWITERQLMN
jgi:pimeloyl-ACP methyl ester carboxylesterase